LYRRRIVLVSPIAAEVTERIAAAINAHDLDALVGCFATDYRNQTPVHPARSFEGNDQVRRNWTEIFAGLPDIEASLRGTALDGDTIWAEWEWNGTRRDGERLTMRGVTILGVNPGGTVSWARFYMEPLDEGATGVEIAVSALLGRTGIPQQ
jgi:ketosteroid isomerase-like protein